MQSCVHFSCCSPGQSPIASASAAAHRLHPLQLLLADCVQFSYYFPTMSVSAWIIEHSELAWKCARHPNSKCKGCQHSLSLNAGFAGAAQELFWDSSLVLSDRPSTCVCPKCMVSFAPMSHSIIDKSMLGLSKKWTYP